MGMLDWFQTFHSAVHQWDSAEHQPQVVVAEQERAQFLERYPIEAWETMSVEEYAQGCGTDSVTAWLEHRTTNLGRLPALSANIHLIYKQGGETWRFPKDYENVDDAWRAIRAGYVKAFKLAEADDWSAIDGLSVFRPGRLTLHKALNTYFPDKLLPISATSHMSLLAARVLRDRWRGNVHSKMGHCELNAVTLKTLWENSSFREASSVALVHFLYGWSDPRTLPAVYKVSPGQDAQRWSECLKNDFVSMGWDAVGDLTRFESKASFNTEFHRHYLQHHNGKKSATRHQSNQLWELCREAPEGALIVANHGPSQVLGVGQLVGEYLWRAERTSHKHTREVIWDTTAKALIPKQNAWAMETVLQVQPHELDGILGPLVGDAFEYVFFKVQSFNAHVGVAVRGQQVAFCVPSSGDGSPGLSRNHERSKLFEHLLDRLRQCASMAVVVATSGGRSDTAVQDVRAALMPDGHQALSRAFKKGRNFRFDFWLDMGSAISLEVLARHLDLIPWSHANLRANWPGDASVDMQPLEEPRWWVFQANPNRYDLEGALAAQTSLTWQINQHRADIRCGDHVFLWLAGVEAGIRAVATVADDPLERPWDDDGFTVGEQPKLNKPCTRVALVVEAVLDRPLYAKQMRRIDGLEDLSILRNARGTNFPVNAEEAGILMGLIQQPLRAVEESLSFEGLMTHLRTQGLSFDLETVADFLLAMQSRRFVILTGISGTGKTRLAMAVADCFPLVEEVPVEDASPVECEDDVRVTINAQPYMLRYHRCTLPVHFTAQIPEFQHDNKSYSIQVCCPGGEAVQSIYSPGNYVLLHLSGVVRQWFQETLSEGDPFELSWRSESANAQPALHIALPQRPARRERRRVPNCAVIAVRPDWTDNRGLLGYLNPITGLYVTTPFLELLLRADLEARQAAAEARPPHPFFVILDEMNLARVEHYFADFLSAMESGEPMTLHDSLAVELGEGEGQRAIARQFRIPNNVSFIGTVNVDETTYMFSPKVLDRAFTLEFNRVDLANFGRAEHTLASSPLALDRWKGRLEPLDKPNTQDWVELGERFPSLHQALITLHDLLSSESRHFGYRVACEIARFVHLAAEQASHQDAPRVALDLAMVHKVLPKLHGTQQDLGLLLDRLLDFARSGRADDVKPVLASVDASSSLDVQASVGAEEEGAVALFPHTARKLRRMKHRLARHGFTAFVE